jgi:DMSO/TMAO reductase YedYZ molybdopterin-dependent catalytic subunit
VIHGDLVVRTESPFNAETPLSAQIGIITPNARFYVRNHFAVPRVDAASWSLSVGGLVRHRHTFGLAELRRLPSRSVIVTLECAGNGRALLEPPVAGEQWQLGAVGTAEWTGVPLVEVLDRAGVGTAVREIVFRGLDHALPRRGARGKPEPLQHFERSLPVEVAQHPDTLLAYAMNGELIPANHGFPLRLVVPGWYGMASVKWLAEITATDRPFSGYFQTDHYVLAGTEGGAPAEPVTQIRVRALITEPEPGDVIRQGELTVRGYTWSGHGEVTRVEVDAGQGWHAARLLDEPLPHAWRRWELTTRVRAGRLVLRARASDSGGNTQPEEPPWNRLGYANNGVQPVPVAVVD